MHLLSDNSYDLFTYHCVVNWQKECGLGPCSLNPCRNEGFCIDINATDYSCTCRTNCNGQNCEICSKLNYGMTSYPNYINNSLEYKVLGDT